MSKRTQIQESRIARLARSIKTRMPNHILAVVLTLGWRIARVRNWLFPEVEKRWPKVYLTTWRSLVFVHVQPNNRSLWK